MTWTPTVVKLTNKWLVRVPYGCLKASLSGIQKRHLTYFHHAALLRKLAGVARGKHHTTDTEAEGHLI